MSTVYYRTKDGLADYKFSFECQSDGTWRAYILDHPSYGSRDTGLHVTHRLSDDGRKYVCWSAPLKTEADARKVAALWADATQRYIRTGQTIDEQMRESRNHSAGLILSLCEAIRCVSIRAREREQGWQRGRDGSRPVPTANVLDLTGVRW